MPILNGVNAGRFPKMSGASIEDHRGFARTLEEFISFYGECSFSDVSEDAPIVRWVKMFDTVEKVPNLPILPNGSMFGDNEGLATICDYYAARFAVSGISILLHAHKAGSTKIRVAKSFVLAELGRRDTGCATDAALPSGIGTLLVAADCVRLEGKSVEIFGSGSPGLDVEAKGWDKSVLRFEAKGRAFGRALHPETTVNDMLGWMRSEVVKGGADLGERTAKDGVAALRTVSLFSFLPTGTASLMQDRAEAALRDAAKTKPGAMPHAVCLHLVGLEIESTGHVVATSLLRYVEVVDAVPQLPAHVVDRFHALTGRTKAIPGLCGYQADKS